MSLSFALFCRILIMVASYTVFKEVCGNLSATTRFDVWNFLVQKSNKGHVGFFWKLQQISNEAETSEWKMTPGVTLQRWKDERPVLTCKMRL